MSLTKKKAKKIKPEKVDGINAKDLKNLRNAIRQIWHRSHVRKIVVARCTGADGFPVCEKCKKKTPAIKIDHLVAVGQVDGGFIERMFVPSKKLQGLCKRCHQDKTNLENRLRPKKPKHIKDFY